MAAAVCEKYGGLKMSVRVGERVLTQIYTVRNAASMNDAEAAVLSATPYSFGAPYSSLRRTVVNLEQLEDASGQIYTATVEWHSTSEPIQAGEIRVRYVGGSKTVRRLYDLATAAIQGDITASELDGAINVVDGQPEGVDVLVPDDSLVIERGLAKGTITLSYLAALRSIRGHINDAPWNGFNAAEVLFREVDAVSSNNDIDKITYTFGIESQVANLDVGPFTFATKKGWDLVSVGTYVKIDPTKNVKIPVARWAAVHEVYPRADFATQLGF